MRLAGTPSTTKSALAVLVVGSIIVSCTGSDDRPAASTTPPAPVSSDPNDWYEPPVAGASGGIGALCERGVCAHGVALPSQQLLEIVTDIEMPETLGALSLERVWTGTGDGIFGDGWGSPWDLRVVGGVLHGPVSSEPRVQPSPDSEVVLADGTRATFDAEGLVSRICLPGAKCVDASREPNRLTLRSAGARSVEIQLSDGRATGAVSDDGRAIAYRYEGDHLIAANRNDGARSWAYGYRQGHLVLLSGTDSERTVDYDGDRVTTVTDADGTTWAFTTTDNDIQVSAAAIGASRSYRFSGELLVEATDRELGTILTRSLNDGRVTSESRPLDGLSTSFLEDGVARVEVRRPDAPLRQIEYRYDGLGRLVNATGADGTTSVTYRNDTRAPSTVDVNGSVTSYEYGDDGLLAATQDADDYRIEIERAADGSITAISDGLLRNELRYDAAGRLVSQSSGSGSATAEYDPLGRLATTSDATGVATSYGYDDDGRLASFGDAGAPTPIEYEPDGALTPGAIDSLGLATLDEQQPVPLQELSAPTVTPGENGTATYDFGSGRSITYDESGRPVEVVVDAARTTRAYDEAGRLSALTTPDGREFDLTYTPAGRIRAVQADGVSLEPTWHGTLMTSLETSAGTRYEYRWDEAGRLLQVDAGPTTWEYDYNAEQRLASVSGPVGTTRYEWDAEGLPARSIDASGRSRSFEWDEGRLATVRNGERLIQLEWADDRLTRLQSEGGDDNVEELSIEYDDDSGRVVAYNVGEDRTVIGYGTEGVDSIERNGHVERWEYEGAQVSIVREGDDADEVYEFDWVSPGVPRTVTRGEETLLTVSADDDGRVTSIVDDDGDEVAAFAYENGRIAKATSGDDTLTLERDAERRLTRAMSDDVDIEASYERGAVSSIRSDEQALRFEYDDGRLVSSTATSEDDQTAVAWDGLGRPTTFTSTEGNGEFLYERDLVDRIDYDAEQRDVSYDEDGEPSAGGTGGEFLDDLFTNDGRFAGESGPLDGAPSSPLLDSLPVELGFEVPAVATGDDISSVALDRSVPALPVPLVDNVDNEFAQQVAGITLASGATERVPISPARSVELAFNPSEMDVEELFAGSATAGVGGSVLDRLGGDRCLFCRLTDLGGNVLSGVGSGVERAFDLLGGNPVSRALVSAGFFFVDFLAKTVCGIAVQCYVAVQVSAAVIQELTIGDATAKGVLIAAVTAPAGPLAGKLRSAIGVVGETRTMSTALSLLKRSGVDRPVRAAADRVACSIRRVVCISLTRWGTAAEHVQDAQQAGFARVLRIDRLGASARRSSALRGITRVVGMDRDEYPPAFARAADVLPSIRYIDPGLNRGLGATLGAQTSLLPNGSRFYLRVVP